MVVSMVVSMVVGMVRIGFMGARMALMRMGMRGVMIVGVQMDLLWIFACVTS